MIINGSGTRVIKYSGGFTDHEEPFPGLMKVLESRYERKMQGKFEVYPIEYYMHEDTCRQCEGKRLNANAGMSYREINEWFAKQQSKADPLTKKR